LRLPYKNGNNPQRSRLWPVYDDVVGIVSQCPETQRMGGKIGPRVAATANWRQGHMPKGWARLCSHAACQRRYFWHLVLHRWFHGL